MIDLRPWDEADWPISWRWIDDAWDYISDDFMPRDITAFVEFKRREQAVNVGVWRDEMLVGLLILVPVSPVLAQGHCIFRRRALKPSETLEVLRQAQALAWSWGYWKICGQVYPGNRAMVRLLESAGAYLEGRLLSQTQKDGTLTDMLSYALLRESPSSLNRNDYKED